jgi:hypothetical protein
MYSPQPAALWSPPSFAERGTAAPFTTPALCGARVTRTLRGPDIIIPNPSGKRGIYIVPASAVQEFCVPTLHDRGLISHLLKLPAITPATMREAARAVARQGLAGRAAADAALRADQTDRRAYARLKNNLIALIMTQTGSSAEDAAEDRPGFDSRANNLMLRLARQLGREPDAIADDIDTLASWLLPIGIGGIAPTPVTIPVAEARLAACCGGLKRLRDNLNVWPGHALPKWAPALTLIDLSASITGTLAARFILDARKQLHKIVSILEQPVCDQHPLRRLIGRAEDLLDGWEEIILVWHIAASAPAAQRRAIDEIVTRVPVLPQEINEWGIKITKDDDIARLRQSATGQISWPGASQGFSIIARNEQLRTLCA